MTRSPRPGGLLRQQRELIQQAGIQLKKGLGQHFLVDPGVVRGIVRLAALTQEDTVLEVGPGLGSLTLALAEAAGKTIALEKDEKLYHLLQEQLAPYPQVELIRADALFFDYASLEPGTKVVSNLPYAVATPLLFRFLEQRGRICEMVLMLQQEVADRLLASPGSKTYGPLTVAVQLYCQVEKGFKVPPAAFWPRPKVHSMVVRFVLQTQPRVALTDEELFFKIVRASFAQRRKTLLNNLRQAQHLGHDPGFWAEACRNVGIDPARRGETLSLEEFAALTHSVASQGR
ncbi:MAG: 16S rRNA (adenine(1518)-N(6)/adenine(1519)-N(6))-dimethyltransferase RsmA [Candidatus Tectomicrobia bacterium]|uniref:Ribosomal RNA small subunit methyltransferase A n=1 Tax=Tectimicrobiota bacterium TaxID=2528274 RepID=A0A932FWR7_UNCTE|nr:16S rRNA (adenine(1518)-N(6)/adenine(1519)-N(6))-dimethyltransferase RsmA [Candidatus Tectomicrobia bacterium]